MLPALASPRSDSSGAFGRVGRAVETGWPGLDGALRADAEGCGLVRGGVVHRRESVVDLVVNGLLQVRAWLTT